MKYAKRYPCVGGPLDGQTVTRNDFMPEDYAIVGSGATAHRTLIRGAEAKHAKDYVEFNRANRAERTAPSMIWLHRSLLPGKAALA